MNRPSITRRLIVTLTVGVTALWLIGGFFTIVVMQDALMRTLDGGLRETAERILPLAVDGLADDDGDGDLYTGDYHETMLEPGRGEYVVYQVRAGASILMRSHDAPELPFSAPLAEGFVSASPWRIYTTGDAESGVFIQVAEAEDRRNAALWGSAVALLLPLLLLVPASIIGIGLAVERGLAPLRRLGDEVARRDVANLELVGLDDAPAELRPMTEAINGLLLRLRAAFDAERALAANSAHELRTPIAGSLAQTQRLVEELAGHPSQQRDLPGRIEIAMQPEARLVARLDVDALGIIVRNLIENADKHGTVAGPIEVRIGDNVLQVSNEGDVVPAAQLARLVRRFERGTTSASGAGLGLAIVDTIARQVDGRLELHSPAIGRTTGFSARVVVSERAEPTPPRRA